MCFIFLFITISIICLCDSAVCFLSFTFLQIVAGTGVDCLRLPWKFLHFIIIPGWMLAAYFACCLCKKGKEKKNPQKTRMFMSDEESQDALFRSGSMRATRVAYALSAEKYKNRRKQKYGASRRRRGWGVRKGSLLKGACVLCEKAELDSTMRRWYSAITHARPYKRHAVLPSSEHWCRDADAQSTLASLAVQM